MVNRHSRNYLSDSMRNYIAKTVFTYMQTLGLADRHQQEDLTEQVIMRLEKSMSLEEQTKTKKVERTFPGMENLVASVAPQPPGKEQIESVVNEVLAEKASVKAPAENAKASLESVKAPAEGAKAPTETAADSVPHSPAPLPPAGELKLTENALIVLEKRYLQKDSQGNVVETPEELFRRVSKYIASAEVIFDKSASVEEWEARFYNLMTSLEFLPNSPTLMNAGRELGQLSACFVLPIDDTMESIFDAVKYTALIHKSGGGTGFSFSRIRPKKDRVGSTGGVASGPVSFMRAFDTATDVIKQGGMRRGANMGILNVDHPDILEFISSKEDPKAFTNFNISVAITDGFMKAVEQNADFDLINPHSKEKSGKLNAQGGLQ